MKEQRRTIYNPRRLRWEYEDGSPVDGSTPRRDLVSRAFVELWRTKGLVFGEYAGQPLCEIPTDYLRELKSNNESLNQAVREEIRRRDPNS